MEEHEDIRNDASTTTAVGHEGTLYQALQRQLEGEAERNQLANTGVLKATSGNATKRLKIKQDARVVTRASKNAEAAIKQIATQELQAEKGRMQEWKRYVMQEVAQELQAIRSAQYEVIEAQRQSL